MAKMYVANCTRQNWTLFYTLPEMRAPRQQPVDAGGQVQISGDLTADDIRAVVEQFEPYGMLPATEVSRARREISLLYNVGAPVTRGQMLAALERNIQALDLRGRQQRDAAAVGVAKIMEDNNPREFREAEFSVKQERDDGGAPDVNEQVFVKRQGGERPTAVRGRPRKKVALA